MPTEVFLSASPHPLVREWLKGGGGGEMTNLCHKREAVEGSHYMRGGSRGRCIPLGEGW